MGVGQPFMYDAVPNESFHHPYSNFDPRAASKASLVPKSAKPARDGPLVSFNLHPDSYIVAPYGNLDAKPMRKSTKKRITQIRHVVLGLRILQFLGAVGLLIMMILISGVATPTVWLMRIPPGFAILHTIYGIYHLSRRPSGRTPASSGSYMLFASAADASIIPFYAFTAVIAYSQYHMALSGTNQQGQWGTLLSNGSKYMVLFTGAAFLSPTIAACLHLASLSFSLWLAVTFRKITNLPPDMNPLEDNLTSRHKSNRFSAPVSIISEKHLTEPFESNRRSGLPSEGVSRPPTIPFLHTRTQSSDSFSTYDSRLDLPSWKHQSSSSINSSRTSFSDLKRSSLATPPSPSKRGSYMELSRADPDANVSSTSRLGNLKEAWFTSDSLNSNSSPHHGSHSPKRSVYTPSHFHRDSLDMEDLSMTLMNAFVNPLGDESLITPPVNPLASNPTRPKHQSALAEISPNRESAGDLAEKARQMKRYTTGNLADASRSFNLNLNRSNTGDVADMSLNPNLNNLETRKQNPFRSSQQAPPRKPLPQDDIFKARPYGELRAGTPPVVDETFKAKPYGDLRAGTPPVVDENFKAKSYGKLKAGAPPVLVGAGGAMRQTSTGNDYAAMGSLRTHDRRDSIKTGEEGRSEPGIGGAGARMRKISGMEQ